MAIDTENKRRSVQAYWIGAARPVPDGTISAADRAMSAWFYAGISYHSGVGGGSPIPAIILMRRNALCLALIGFFL